MKSTIGRGIVGGFLGALVMAVLAYIGSLLGIVPRALLDLLGRMFLMPDAPALPVLLAGLATHVFMGALWGALFAAIFSHGGVRNGVFFAMVPWAGMMVLTFVMSQVDLISLQLTWVVAAVTFLLHVVYGIIIGFWLKRPEPATVLKHA